MLSWCNKVADHYSVLRVGSVSAVFVDFLRPLSIGAILYNMVKYNQNTQTPSLDFEATKKRRKLWAVERRAHHQSLGAKLTLGCDFRNYVVSDRSKLFQWSGLVILVAVRGNRSWEKASCRLNPLPPFYTRLSMLKKDESDFPDRARVSWCDVLVSA